MDINEKVKIIKNGDVPVSSFAVFPATTDYNKSTIEIGDNGLDFGMNINTYDNLNNLKQARITESGVTNQSSQGFTWVEAFETINKTDAIVYPAPNATTVKINDTLLLDDNAGNTGTLDMNGVNLQITSSGNVNIKTINTVQNATHYLNISDSFATGVGPIQKSANLSCNPSTGNITASTFTGTASTASSVTTTSSNTASTCYIPFTDTTAGANKSLLVDDTTGPLSYQPSTATLTTGIVSLTTGGAPTFTLRNNCINTVPTNPNIYFASRTSALSSGSNNIAIGSSSGGNIAGGNNNVLLGLSTGSALTTGSGNMALGAGSLQTVTTGLDNVAIGYASMNASTGAAGRNTCLGANSGNAISTTTTGQNVCIGYNSGLLISTGSNNTCVGSNANNTAGNTTLTNSTAIGFNTNNANFSSSTAIGVGATNTSANQIILGTASETVSIPGSLTFRLTEDNTTGTYYIPFSKSVAGVEGILYVDTTTSPLSYNPALGRLTTTEYSGSLYNNQTVNGSIGFGTVTTSGTMNIGTSLSSGSLNIATGITTGNINIGPSASGNPSSNVTIMPRGGWTGTFQVGGNSASAKLLCATNLEVNYPISTSITTAPTTSRQLGYTVNQSTAGWTTALTLNTQTNITSVAFTNVDYGTYLFEAKVQINPADNTSSRQQILGINTVSANYGTNIDLEYTTANVGYPMLTVMKVFNIYADTTVYLVGYIAGTNGTVVTASSAGIFSWTRIA